MKLTDLDKLKKMMDRCQGTDNDNELLVSIKAANRILAAYPYTWSQVLSRVVSVVNEIEEDPELSAGAGPSATGAQLEAAKAQRNSDMLALFERALDGVAPGGFRDFLLDLEAQWENKRYLSPAQLAALKRAAARGR